MVGDVRVAFDGLMLGESPRWRDGRLYLADLYAEEVVALHPDGRRETVVGVPAQPSGFGWLPDGTLVVASMRDATILRVDAGVATPVVALAPGPPLLNDMVVAGGRIYVGGMPDIYRIVEESGPEGLADFPQDHLYLVDPETGEHRVVAHDIALPNGVLVTPDGRTLILAETLGRRLLAFDVGADGSLASRRVWADLPCMPDGICLDAEGAVWVAAPGPPEERGFWRVAEGGAVLERRGSDRHGVAVTLGGPDGADLFMVEAQELSVSRIAELRTPGNSRVVVGRVPVPGP